MMTGQLTEIVIYSGKLTTELTERKFKYHLSQMNAVQLESLKRLDAIEEGVEFIEEYDHYLWANEQFHHTPQPWEDEKILHYGAKVKDMKVLYQFIKNINEIPVPDSYSIE